MDSCENRESDVTFDTRDFCVLGIVGTHHGVFLRFFFICALPLLLI